MKCPVCNKNHKYQHTAQQCFQNVIISMDMEIVAGEQLSKKESQMKERMKNYYFNLPIHPKFNKI